jgi:tRNA 2-thiocytidine biosynthesis protein TtcA
MSDPDRIAYFLLKPVARACKEFDLLAEGDRIAVAVSGGKDSRALLDLLLRYQKRVPFAYELVALHIIGTSAGFPDLRPQLEPWFQELGVAYHFALLELPPEEPLPLDCRRCSWNRRKVLFAAAAELGCNKLAFGHHADDAAATTLLSLMFGGKLETMVPRVEFFDGAMTLIRPLIYVPEKELVRYEQAMGFPDPPSLCPQGLTSQRAQVKELLQHFGREQKQIRTNLWRAARQAMGF